VGLAHLRPKPDAERGLTGRSANGVLAVELVSRASSRLELFIGPYVETAHLEHGPFATILAGASLCLALLKDLPSPSCTFMNYWRHYPHSAQIDFT
jgi:hypothetical protein